jgi:hypothetical protein
MGFDKAARLFDIRRSSWRRLRTRGRTLNHSFIILDKAQNTTPEQMKMFLTRIGFGTKAVITGMSQTDLARGQKSGLVEAARVWPACAGSRSSFHQRRSCGIRWCRRSSTPTIGTRRRQSPTTGTAAMGRRCATRRKLPALSAVQYANNDATCLDGRKSGAGSGLHFSPTP